MTTAMCNFIFTKKSLSGYISYSPMLYLESKCI